MPRKLSKRAEKRKSGREVVRATVWLDVDTYEGTLRACEKAGMTLAKFVNETLKKALEELQARVKKRKRRTAATSKPLSKRIEPPASAPRSRKATSSAPTSKPRSRKGASIAPPEPPPSTKPRSRRGGLTAPPPQSAPSTSRRSTVPPRSSRR